MLAWSRDEWFLFFQEIPTSFFPKFSQFFSLMLKRGSLRRCKLPFDSPAPYIFTQASRMPLSVEDAPVARQTVVESRLPIFEQVVFQRKGVKGKLRGLSGVNVLYTVGPFPFIVGQYEALSEDIHTINFSRYTCGDVFMVEQMSFDGQRIFLVVSGKVELRSFLTARFEKLSPVFGKSWPSKVYEVQVEGGLPDVLGKDEFAQRL